MSTLLHLFVLATLLFQQCFLSSYAVPNINNLDVSSIYAEIGLVKVAREERDSRLKEAKNYHYDVCFDIHLPQCHIEELYAFVKDTTDSSHRNFQKFLTISEVEDLTKCEDHQLHIDTILQEWFPMTTETQDNSTFQYKIKNKKINVCTSLDYLTTMLFPSNTFSTYAKVSQISETRGHNGGGNFKNGEAKDSFRSFYILCNEKKVFLPSSLDSHIALITGLHYFNFKRHNHSNNKKRGTKSTQSLENEGQERNLSTEDYTKKTSSKLVTSSKENIMNDLSMTQDDESQCYYNTATSQCVNPTLIQSAYNYPAATQYYSYQQGVVEFMSQLYDPSDLEEAVQMMATSEYAKNYKVSGDDATQIEADIGSEASLDVEYIVMVGGGVPTYVQLVQPQSAFVLEWATDLLDGNRTDLLPENGGPYIWSMSYGAPEWSLLYFQVGGTSNYISESEIALAKMASLGITNIISSGDSGSPAGNPACPIEANYDILLDNQNYVDCPFTSGCNSATYVVQYQDFTCSMPIGWNTVGYDDVPLLGCQKIYEECQPLFENLKTIESLQGCNFRFLEYKTHGDESSLKDIYILYSENTAACKEPIVYQVESCTLSSFEYKSELYGTMFWPSYPATSAFATAVASTAINPTGEVGDQIVTYEFNPGGGFSSVIPRPWYQIEYNSVVSTYLNNENLLPPSGTFNSSNRGYPDLALYGQDVIIVADGQLETIGGTSCSAPILSGILGTLINIRLNKYKNNGALGLLNPYLYQMKVNNSNSFTKLGPYTIEYPGSNQQYGGNNCSYDNNVVDYFCKYGYLPSSEISWDAVTGLGTPNYTQWLIALAQEEPSSPSSSMSVLMIVIIIVVILIVITTVITVLVYYSNQKKKKKNSDLVKLISKGERELTWSSSTSNIQQSQQVNGYYASSSFGYQPPQQQPTTTNQVDLTI